MGFIEAIGRAFGNGLGTLNPWILFAGFLVARKSPRSGAFFVWFALATVICVILNLLFDIVLGSGSSFYEDGRGLTYTAVAVLIATGFFAAVRKFLGWPAAKQAETKV